MILLSHLDTLTAFLGSNPATRNPSFYASYMDTRPSTGAMNFGVDALIPLTGSTPVVVLSPSVGPAYTRIFAAFLMVNTDSAPITLSFAINGTVILCFVMAVGDNISYSRQDGEFRVFDASGSLKQTVLMANAALTTGPNIFTGVQTFQDLIAPNSLVGIKGTILNDNPQAGNIGEVVTATVATGASVSLATLTSANVTGINLTAGDWDVSGSGCFILSTTTVMGYLSAGLSQVSATLPLNNAGVATVVGAGTNATTDATVNPVLTLPTVRISIAATSTVYLVARAKFTTSTCRAYGTIYARRSR
jgi:hypothetical protein